MTIKGPESRQNNEFGNGFANTVGRGKEEVCQVIGISDYPGDENDLRYADNDAMDMCKALLGYGFPQGSVYLLTNLNASFSAIKSAVDEIKAEVQEDDEVLFFFSGHGARCKADDGDREAIDEAIVNHDGANLVYIWDGELRNWF